MHIIRLAVVKMAKQDQNSFEKALPGKTLKTYYQ